MNKIKKIFISFGAFITGLVSKVLAFDPSPYLTEVKYGIYEPKEPTIGEKLLSIFQYVIPIVLFIIGLFVILNKKITKKVKIIVVSILVIIAILGYVVINYMMNNF